MPGRDPESLRQRLKITNDENGTAIPPPHPIARRHPLQLLKITGICFASIWYLNDQKNFFHNILHSPKVSHTWFKLGLAMSIGNYRVVTFIYISCIFYF